jgi:hypothetical protein
MNPLVFEDRELTEGEAFSLTKQEVLARKVIKIAKTVPPWNGAVLKHITELDQKPIECYEFWWVDREENK